MADPYFTMMDEGGDAPSEGGEELLGALEALGLYLREVVEVSPEDSISFNIPRLDSLGFPIEEEEEGLSLFGQSFFTRNNPYEFRALENGAVGADYRLGPGDQIILLITGDLEAAYSLDVNRSGMILISDVGQVPVQGLTLAELEDRLYDRIGRVYSGIRRDGVDATTFFDVSLGKTRTIAVYVSGEVVYPNRYPLSGVATLLEALHAAGGPTDIGSLRRVRIERGNESLGEFDLYPYFVDGSSRGDIRLENGDLVFVPPSEGQVTLVGEVRREAIFEMLPGETSNDLIKFGGGLNPRANSRFGTVDRFLPASEREMGFERVVLDLPMNGEVEENGEPFEMFPGDSITIHSVIDFTRNWAEVEGAVWAPGTYQIKSGQTLSDLLATAGGVRPDGFESIIHISRMNQQTGQRSLIRTPLTNASELSIEEFDHVTLFGQDSLLVPDSVSIFGNVLEPGRYPYHHQMNAEDLILQAGGFRRGAIPWEAEVVAPVFDIPGVLSQSTPVSLSTALPYPDSSVAWPEESSLSEVGAVDFPLGPDYEVYVRRLPTFQDVRHVTIVGEVQRPGTYVLQSVNEKLSSVINRAGGLAENAYPQGGRVTRLGTPVGADFLAALNGDLQEDIVLADEDIILVPVYDPTILVQGAVAFESRMRYREGMKMDEVIANAGGYIFDADPGRLSVEYLNGERATAESTLWIFKSVPDIEPGSRITVPLKSASPRAGFNWNNALSATLATMSTFATIYIAIGR
jgi:protein involved in polysaccharide export with SLBB domain